MDSAFEVELDTKAAEEAIVNLNEKSFAETFPWLVSDALDLKSLFEFDTTIANEGGVWIYRISIRPSEKLKRAPDRLEECLSHAAREV